MIIICPKCGFRRDVPEDRIPPKAAVATCPHCRHRFRFLPEETEVRSSSPQPLASPFAQEEASQPLSQSASPAQERTDTAPFPRHEADTADTVATQAVKSTTQETKAAEEQEILGTPWDMAPERLGGVEAFYQTCLRVMFAAPYVFSRLRADAPQSKALLFYLVVSVLQVLLERFWGQALSSFLLSSATQDPQLRQLADMLAPADNIILTLLLRSALLTVQLYVMSSIFYVLLRLVAPSKRHFSLVFQVVAYSVAPELLCLVPILGSLVGMIWSVACCVVGLKYALALNWPQAFSVVLPIYLLLIPVLIQIAAGMAAL